MSKAVSKKLIKEVENEDVLYITKKIGRKATRVVISMSYYEKLLKLIEDYEDIKSMIEAEKTPKSEITEYRKYRQKRFKNVSR